MPIQASNVTHNNDGHFYRIAIDIAKEGAEVWDLTPYFKGRVGDDNFGLQIVWYYQGRLLDVTNMTPYIKGNVGHYSFDEQKNLQMAPDADVVTSHGKPSDCQANGQATYYFPQQMFPTDGIFKGFIGLEDENQNLTGVDIWFRVLPGVAKMGHACDVYVDVLDKTIADFKEKIRQQSIDFDTALNQELQKEKDLIQQKLDDAGDAIDEDTAALKKLAASVGEIQAQIDAGNVVTLKQHNADLQTISNHIDNRLDRIHPTVETFADLNAVKAKYPSGAEGVFVTDDGHRAVYRGGQWVDGGVYQAVGLANGEVHTRHTDFATHQVELFQQRDALNGVYNAVNNKIVFQDINTDQRYSKLTCFKFKADPSERTYTVSGTDFNVFGSTEDGTLAWSDNQSDGVTGPYTFTVPNNVVWVYVSFLTAKYDKFHCFTGSIKFDGTGHFLLDAPLASPLADKVVTPEATTFIEGHTNLFKAAESSNGIYNAVNNKVIFQDATVDNRFGKLICFRFKADPSERTYTVSGTDYNIFGSTEDGTLAWSDNQVNGVTGPYTFTIPDNVVWVYVSFLTKRKDGYRAVAGKSLDQVGYRLSDEVAVPSKGNWQIDVGKGYQYERLIDAVKSIGSRANKDNICTIYLHDTSSDYTGTTFDLLAELGGTTYLPTIENATDNMQGFHLPPYVNLVGVGKVTLKAELPDTVTLNQSSNFSTLEIEQGNNDLRNLTVKVKNGRYPVHDESRDKYPNATHSYTNVTFIHEGNASGLWDSPSAFGCGTSGGCTYNFNDCIFDASKSDGYPFGLHNYAPQLGSQININGAQMLINQNRPVAMHFGFNGFSPVTTDKDKYAACYTHGYLY